MTTYRERREKRAEKLREWSDSRAAQADAAHARVHAIADGIPFGQPILVGHHSEAHARRDQRRMDDGMRASIDNSRMAARHEQRADTIESQLATSIYDDDPDAVERLTEKLAGLEAKREDMKAKNAAYRKEHKDELKAMTPYERSCAVPFPSYSLSNLGGRITDARKRLERLRRDRADAEAGVREVPRRMYARFGGTCPDCGGEIAKGDLINYYKRERVATHAECPEKEGNDAA